MTSFRSLDGLIRRLTAALITLVALPIAASASEADLTLPTVRTATFHFPGLDLSSSMVLWIGIAVCFCGMLFGLFEYLRLKKLPAHESMLEVSRHGQCGRVPG